MGVAEAERSRRKGNVSLFGENVTFRDTANLSNLPKVGTRRSRLETVCVGKEKKYRGNPRPNDDDAHGSLKATPLATLNEKKRWPDFPADSMLPPSRPASGKNGFSRKIGLGWCNKLQRRRLRWHKPFPIASTPQNRPEKTPHSTVQEAETLRSASFFPYSASFFTTPHH